MISPPRVPETFPSEFDQFTLLDRLASGGMADVYLAVERHTIGRPRWIAIKKIRADLVDQPEFIQFFLTEGRVSLACSHPNLPTAYHLGVVDHRPYLAVEYIPGPTLLAVMRAGAARRTALAVPAALTVAMAMARALEHLHTLTDANGVPLQVIHRDVTPQNLLIGPGGVVKLIDFGVARATMQTYRTKVGVIKGKYAYIAPEQLVRHGRVDQRADLFSWGTVVHELLTGRPLFHGRTDVDTCDRIRSLPIFDPAQLRPEIPPALAQIVLTALERDPDRRWSSATALVEALERAVEQCGIWPWPGQLAREVQRLCGEPRVPSLVGGTVHWSDAPLENVDFLDDVDTSLVRRDPAPAAVARAIRDPQLSYFLQAGAVESPWHPSESNH